MVVSPTLSGDDAFPFKRKGISSLHSSEIDDAKRTLIENVEQKLALLTQIGDNSELDRKN